MAGGLSLFFNCIKSVLGQAQLFLYQNYLNPSLEQISVIVEPLFCYYPLTLLTGIPLEVRFEVGHHRSSKALSVSTLRRFAKVNIQIHKTAIRDQSPRSDAEYTL